MAAPEPYETKTGRKWRIRYRTPDGKSTSKRGFNTKKEAALFGAKLELDMAAGDFINPAAGRVTVGELAPTWLRKKRALKPSSYEPLELAWRIYVEPRWGATPLKKITTSAVEGWLAELSLGEAPSAHKYEKERGKPRSASTVLRALGVLAGILDMAVKDKRISKNPARGAENLPKKVSMKSKRYLSHAEVDALAGAVDDAALKMLVTFLAYTGLRWGEAGALTVREIDLERSRVRVRLSATWVRRELHVGPVKSWEARAVPIPPFLAMLLQDYLAGKPADTLVFPDPKTGKNLGMPDLRADRNGWWTEMLRAADLERLTPHDLRHTYASLSVSSGANIKALQKSLGHKSAAMTLDEYADLFDSDLDQVALALDKARSGSIVSKMCPPSGVSDPAAP